MGLFNLFNKKPNPDETIKKLNAVCISDDSPIQKRFSEQLSSTALYELYVFNFFYAWLYNIDHELIELTDLNIAKYHLIANSLLNDICKKTFSDADFHLLFRDRFANYRKELALVRQHQFNHGYYPMYFYDLIIKSMLQESTQDYYHESWTESEVTDVYYYSINYLQEKLDKAFK